MIKIYVINTINMIHFYYLSLSLSLCKGLRLDGYRMDRFVLPVRKGGLGNQMFQVAAALVYAKETGRNVLLPLEFYNYHRTTAEDYSQTVFQSIEYRIERPIDANAIEMLKRNGFHQHPGEPGFERWAPDKTLEGNILLHGYFQSYPAFEAHEAFLRDFYLQGLKPFQTTVEPSKQRIGIHVRRGDYLKPPFSEVHISHDISYYKKALSFFTEHKNVTYWIFSDDIEWCKKQDIFQTLPNTVFLDEPNELRSLASMSSCHGGFICAASTFSWWGAFLGAYIQRSPCIVPKSWMRGHDTSHLFPKEWIQLEV
jgi:hypothetical protein